MNLPRSFFDQKPGAMAGFTFNKTQAKPVITYSHGSVSIIAAGSEMWGVWAQNRCHKHVRKWVSALYYLKVTGMKV